MPALDAPRLRAPWTPVLDAQRRAAALAVADDVAARVADPARIAAARAAAATQTQFPRTLQRHAYGIADGDAGVALMCSAFHAGRPGRGWDVVGHRLLQSAAQAAQDAPSMPIGAFGGLAGLVFAAASLSCGGTRYARLLDVLDHELSQRAAAMGVALSDATEPADVSGFDVIAGASGVAACLAEHDGRGVLPQLLSGLVALATPRAGLPGWATPPGVSADDTMDRAYPGGTLNCGPAHGIPGPLAALAVALRRGVSVPDQPQAMRAFAHWLLEQRIEDGWGPGWPAIVAVPEPGGRAGESFLGRDAWCYGTPGVARALWLAGEALHDDELRGAATEAMTAVGRRRITAQRVESPTLCHGVAGLLQIVLRFAHDTGLPVFAETATQLVDDLLAAYDPDRPLGYADVEPGPCPVDRPGLLDGAPGVAMALLAAATDAEPTWDRLFLLS